MNHRPVGELSYEFPDYSADSIPQDLTNPEFLAAHCLESAHWHNDVCPSWVITDETEDYLRRQTGATAQPHVADVRLFVDYLDPEQRECDGKRFFLTVDYEPVLETDDWQQVVKFLEQSK